MIADKGSSFFASLVAVRKGFNQVANIGSIEKPPVASQDGFFSKITQERESQALPPRPQCLRKPGGTLQVTFQGSKVFLTGHAGKQRGDRGASTIAEYFDRSICERHNRDNGQETSAQECQITTLAHLG